MAVLNGERMHDTMERLLPGARSAALLWQGAAVLGGAALGAGQVYGGAAPFGLALVIGCPPSYCLAAALGTLAAGLAFQPMLLGVKLAVAAVAAAAVRRLIDGRPGAGALAGDSRSRRHGRSRQNHGIVDFHNLRGAPGGSMDTEDVGNLQGGLRHDARLRTAAGSPAG